MRHGGRRPGAGRPKHKTVREVALSRSAPSDWPDYPAPVYRDTGDSGGAAFRVSAASAVRSSIPAAAIRKQEMEVAAGRAQRSRAEIEWEFADKWHAQTANSTTTAACRRRDLFDGVVSDEDREYVIHEPGIDGVFRPDDTDPSGSSTSDFLMEKSIEVDGEVFDWPTPEPGELRGLKWTL